MDLEGVIGKERGRVLTGLPDTNHSTSNVIEARGVNDRNVEPVPKLNDPY